MLGIIIELAISWLLIWLLEKKDLSVLGIAPSKIRLRDLVCGITLSALVCVIYYLAIGYLAAGDWTLNKEFSIQSFLGSGWWTLKSVLFEELIFRGALLYIFISRLGRMLACILSAISFGIYHWFSYNLFGDITQMFFTFLLTGIAGFMFAYAFAITRSIYLPVGIHFGYNLVSIVIFSSGPLNDQMMTLKNAAQLSMVPSGLLYLYQVLALPSATLFYLKARQESEEM